MPKTYKVFVAKLKLIISYSSSIQLANFKTSSTVPREDSHQSFQFDPNTFSNFEMSVLIRFSGAPSNSSPFGTRLRSCGYSSRILFASFGPLRRPLMWKRHLSFPGTFKSRLLRWIAATSSTSLHIIRVFFLGRFKTCIT